MPTPDPWKHVELANILAEINDRTRVIECVQGSSACVALGILAATEWPEGGTGQPVALTIVALRDELLLKMIALINHGATRVTTTCALKAFSFGSAPPELNRQVSGYYTTRNEDPLRDLAASVRSVQQMTNDVASDISEKLCTDATVATAGCVSLAQSAISNVRKLVTSNFTRSVDSAYARIRMKVSRDNTDTSCATALAAVATTLDLLINVIVIVMAFRVCTRNYNQYYRKLA